MDDAITRTHIKNLTVNEMDVLWGMYVTTCGFQSIPPKMKVNPYLKEHGASYAFSVKKGRILDEFQLLFIVSGHGYFESASCRKTPIEAGTMILLLPGEWHNYHHDYETGWDEYWVGFNGMNARSMMSAQFFKKEFPVFNIGLNDDLVSFYKSIIAYAEQEKPGYQQIISSIVRHMLGVLYFITQNSMHNNRMVTDKINQARIKMRENIANPIPASQIAEDMGLSYSWFRKAFKKYTGMSPAQFQIQLRMQQAKEFLLNSEKTISEVAYELSFDSAGQFSTFFRQRTGMTPKAFRAQAFRKK